MAVEPAKTAAKMLKAKAVTKTMKAKASAESTYGEARKARRPRQLWKRQLRRRVRDSYHEGD